MNLLKAILFSFVFSMFSTSFSFAATGEVHAECHDGTKLSLSLNTQSCLTQVGTMYLIQKVVNFCSDHCSTTTGKCSVSKMKGNYGDCTTDGPEVMYQGFSATCQDDFALDFKACLPETQFMSIAERDCQGRVNPTTGDVGVKTLVLKDRCN